MTREKALEAMDKLVAMGYTVTLSERDMGQHGHVIIGAGGEMTTMQRWVEVTALSFDKVDLRALVKAADELDLDIGTSRLAQGVMRLNDPLDEAQERKRDVVSGRRRHPR